MNCDIAIVLYSVQFTIATNKIDLMCIYNNRYITRLIKVEIESVNENSHSICRRNSLEFNGFTVVVDQLAYVTLCVLYAARHIEWGQVARNERQVSHMEGRGSRTRSPPGYGTVRAWQPKDRAPLLKRYPQAPLTPFLMALYRGSGFRLWFSFLLFCERT